MYSYDFKLALGDNNVGTVYLPDQNAVNIPVIIYCHGWGGKRRLWTPTEKLCERAMESGIAFVTFDFYGCGETGGDYTKMTYTRWKNNLSDVMTWVKTQPFADKNKVGCYAFSSGSTAALRLAAEEDGIAFVISIGTCISAHIGMGGGGPAKILADNLSSLISGGTIKLFGIDFGIEFYIDTISKAPIHTMKQIKCHVLFLQGTADNTFRNADARMGYDLMKYDDLPATYIELDGGRHELENMADLAVENIFHWLLPIIK